MAAVTMTDEVSNNVNIPDHLAFGILSKLPVKSLKRFSCVHTSWSNLLENPHFMTMYRHNFISKTKNDDDDSCVLLKQHVPNSSHHENLFLLSGQNKVKLDWPPPFQEDPRHIFIVGSCVNGTICLKQGWRKVVLWNPATEEFKLVPVGSRNVPGFDEFIRIYGFGYDHVRDDFKLIRDVYYRESDFEPLEDCPNLPEPSWQIYSQKSNCWRKLDVKIPDLNLYSVGGYAVYLNGVCHWWGVQGQCQQGVKQELLVSFDMSTEVFRTTPMHWRDWREWVNRHLVVLNGCIAMISNIVKNNYLEISILGEVGVGESWIKLFTIGPLLCVEEPIGVGNKGDVFFRKNDDKLICLDLSTQMIREIGVKGAGGYCQILVYKESLHPIGGIN